MSAMFSYEPLSRESDCIRLLTFHRAKDGSLIGELEQKTFGSKPAYEVLSYERGDQKNPRRIIIRGHPFEIHESLYDALQAIGSDLSRTIWIEDICINERDVLEKSRQRNIMYLTYSRAKQVIIWLGLPKHLDGDNGGFHRHGSNYEASKEIANNPYWNQALAIQAIGLAADLKFYFGAQRFTWQEFRSRVAYASQEMKNCTETVLERKLNEYEREGWDSSHQQEEIQQPLEALLEEFKNTRCADKRDKVFAFLSLASDWSDDIINVDYSMSFYELYTRTIHFQQTRTPLNIRSYEIRIKSLDRSLRLMRFSQLVQSLLEGKVEEEACNHDPPKDQSFYTARGALCGEVKVLGPTYSECISSSRANISWKRRLENFFRENSDELLRARQSNEKYTHILQDWKEDYPAKIRAVHTKRSYGYQKDPDGNIPIEKEIRVSSEAEGPRRFLGSGGILGFVPPETQIGDTIYTFWECNIAVVLRSVGSDRWNIIGRADVAPIDQYYSRPDTVWHNALMLDVESQGRGYTVGVGETFPYMMNFRLDVETLQKLTN